MRRMSEIESGMTRKRAEKLDTVTDEMWLQINKFNRRVLSRWPKTRVCKTRTYVVNIGGSTPPHTTTQSKQRSDLTFRSYKSAEHCA